MKILIDMGHPAHVHYFKNFIKIMHKNGHELLVSARDKDIAIKLLEKENIEFVNRGEGGNTSLGKFIYLIKGDIVLYKLAKKFNPDICLSFSSPYLAHASSMLSIPHIAFDDTEHNKLNHKITYPFSEVVLTPNAYKKRAFKKQIKFDGYMELCYLHPKWFRADENILNKLNIDVKQKYCVIRFVSWNAIHDKNHRGFSEKQKIKVVEELKKFCRVFISSESKLPQSLEPYRFNLPVNEMHHLLAFSDLMYGESATMASESAVLGIPAIFHDDTGRGYTDEQESKYGLVHNYTGSIEDQDKSLEKALEIVSSPSAKECYKKKGKKLLSDKINVTSFMVWFIENYPRSKAITKEDPKYQYRFK